MTVLYQIAHPHPGGYRDIELARVVVARDQVRIVDVREPAAVLVVTHDQRTLDVFDALYTMEDGHLEIA